MYIWWVLVEKFLTLNLVYNKIWMINSNYDKNGFWQPFKINPRLPMGGGYHPLKDYFPAR